MTSPVDPPGSYGTTGQYASDYYRGEAPGFGSHPVETSEAPQRSLGEIVSGITADLSTLMQQEAWHAAEEINAMRGLAKGTIRVGAIGSVASSILPRAIAAVLADRPGLRIEVVDKPVYAYSNFLHAIRQLPVRIAA